MAETKKYYHNLDVANNKIVNFILNPATTVQRTAIGATLGPTHQGYTVYDTDDDTQYFWDGTAWLSGSVVETDPIYTASSWYTTTNNSTDWDTAYGWGDHSLAGYLTSYTETDPVWIADKPNYLTSATASTTYEPIISAGTTSQYWRGDKTWQTFPTIPTVGTWGALNYPTWTTGTPFVKMDAAGSFVLDTNTYLTSAVTSIATAGLISGGTITGTGTITTSMATNKLVGRSAAGVGVMEEITVGTGLSLSGGTLSATASSSVGFEMNFLLMGA